MKQCIRKLSFEFCLIPDGGRLVEGGTPLSLGSSGAFHFVNAHCSCCEFEELDISVTFGAS